MAHSNPAAPLEIDCSGVKRKLDLGEEFLFIDCRERDEHQFVHIVAAKLIPLSELQDRIQELEPHRNSEIVVHCHHGGRSMKMTLWLRQQGFADVKSMAGGIDTWSERVDPTLPRY